MIARTLVVPVAFLSGFSFSNHQIPSPSMFSYCKPISAVIFIYILNLLLDIPTPTAYTLSPSWPTNTIPSQINQVLSNISPVKSSSTVENMVRELVARTEKCTCEEFKIELLSLQNEPSVVKLSLIGKIISARSFSFLVVRDIVSKAWNLSFPFLVERVDKNAFLFTFKCRVIGHEHSSCNFDKVLLSNPFGHLIPAYGFWLKYDNDESLPRIYDTPFRHMSLSPDSFFGGTLPEDGLASIPIPPAPDGFCPTPDKVQT